MSDETAEELCREVFRLELKAADKMDTMIQQNSPDEIESAVRGSTNDLLQAFDSPERKARVLAFAHEIAQNINSPELAKEAKGKYERFLEEVSDG